MCPLLNLSWVKCMTSFASVISDRVPEVISASKKLGDPYLKIQLDSHTSAVLLMQQVQELFILPTHQLSPMPNMPAWIMGLMSRRSRILWVVDLSLLLGLQPFNLHTHENNVVILQAGAMTCGTFVHQVEGITWLTRDRIQSLPSHISSSLVPYLQGCILNDQEILLVLDVEAVMRTAIAHPY